MGTSTIQEEFDGYVRAVYPNLVAGSDQYEHLRGAFFGGALVATKHAGDPDVIAELQSFGTNAPIANRVIR